ncbi:MAG: glycine cleavage system protein H [Candidatus Korobacteraceae bacterium]|jgi:glycine cleavage system H lipoate-binding protein
MVNGFQVPENVRFHPGHTWALSESPNLVRVGIDDFASKLIGKVEAVSLPQRGQWIRQGQKILSFKRNGVAVDMISPIEGSVSDVNDAVTANPEVASKDPYGEGWLVTVQSPDAKTNFRNLMGGALARWWMEEAVGRLQKRLPASMGSLALAQDGGIASDNLAAGIPDEEYLKITREFFLA